MDHRQALQQYTTTAVATGSPVRLVAMLYQGALKFIGEAQQAMSVQDPATKGDRINRALRIVHHAHVVDRAVEQLARDAGNLKELGDGLDGPAEALTPGDDRLRD